MNNRITQSSLATGRGELPQDVENACYNPTMHLKGCKNNNKASQWLAELREMEKLKQMKYKAEQL